MIKIAQTVLGKVPEEFKSLDEKYEYKLTKIAQKEDSYISYVNTGRSAIGELDIVDVADLGLPGVRVEGFGLFDYIRTSPIVKVTNKTETSLTFETEGGFYRLDKQGLIYGNE